MLVPVYSFQFSTWLTEIKQSEIQVESDILKYKYIGLKIICETSNKGLFIWVQIEQRLLCMKFRIFLQHSILPSHVN